MYRYVIFIAFFAAGISGQNNSTMMSMMSTQSMMMMTMMTMMQNQSMMPLMQTTPPMMTTMDQCVQTAQKDMQDNLNRYYPNFQNLTSSLTSPMMFYRNLFNQSFTSDSFQAYCKSYRDSHAELDKCSNTSMKNYTMILLAPVDYVCVKKANDYSQAIVCLQNVKNNVNAVNCRANCMQTEQGAMASNPPANATKQQLQDYATADCMSAKCMADCRQAIINSTCGSDKTDLEMEVLKSAMMADQAVVNVSDAMKMAMTSALQVAFPQQCRDIASMSLRNFAGAANDFLATAMNATSNMLQSMMGNNGATTKNPNNGATKNAPWAFFIPVVILVFRF